MVRKNDAFKMKTLMKLRNVRLSLSKSLLLLALCFSFSTFSQETYQSDKYNLSVTFPNLYEEEESDKEGRHVISLSSTYRDMILLTSLFVYDKNIPQDEHNLKEIEALLVTADAFNSKFKVKKIISRTILKTKSQILDTNSIHFNS